MSVVERIERIRKSKGLSRSDLARLCGMSPQRMTNILNGHDGSPGLDAVQRISAALEVPVSSILEDSKAESSVTADSDAKHDAEVIAEMSLRLPPDARRALIQLAALLEKRDRGHEDADDESRSRTHGRTRGGRAGASR